MNLTYSLFTQEPIPEHGLHIVEKPYTYVYTAENIMLTAYNVQNGQLFYSHAQLSFTATPPRGRPRYVTSVVCWIHEKKI